MRLNAAGRRIAHHPDPDLRTFDASLAVQAEPMLDLETGTPELDGGVDRHVVAETRGLEETRARFRQRVADKVESLEQLNFGHAHRALEQRRGRGIEDFEIARIENNAGGVAVAPFDAHRAAVCKH